MSMQSFGASRRRSLHWRLPRRAITSSWAGERLPVVLVSDSPAFDRACTNYYRQGNDPDVARDAVAQFCSCLGAEYANAGLGEDALEFFARTLSEDLTTFIHEYPEGDAWMQSPSPRKSNARTPTTARTSRLRAMIFRLRRARGAASCAPAPAAKSAG